MAETQTHGIDAQELRGAAALDALTEGMSLQAGWESQSDRFARKLGASPAVPPGVMQGVLDSICPPRRPKNELTLEMQGASVTVTYDLQSAERAVHDLDSPVVGPGCEADVDITGVWITGDATDLLASSVLDYIKTRVLAARGAA